jgi:uncharacterized BrkB/YihY/UPF0761 family membrane protein
MIGRMSAAPAQPAHEPKSGTAGAVLTIAFAVAMVLNVVEAASDPGGTVWTIIRWTVSIAFALALLWWIFTKLQDRRRTSRGSTPRA